MNYTPLYIKTDASLLESLIKIDELIKYAKINNIKSLAITDSTMYNVIYFYNKCLENKIKPIIGLEIEIDSKIYILYSKNINGYKNLIKLSTLNNKTINDINKYSKENIIILQNKEDEILFNKYFENIFIGYNNIKNNIYENSIYINKTLYLEKKDKPYLKYLIAINKGTLVINIEDDNNYELNLDTSLLNKNNYLITDLCNIKIEKENDLLPIYNNNSYETLKTNCIKGLKKIFGENAPIKYIERLKYELSIIKKMNFCDYFLVVEDYVKYAKENDILVGPGRGSAAGSLVSYLLNITEIDPLKYNLIFERFLNPERISMPDIDIDFEDTKKDEVINYCINKYGIKKVVPIITFGTMKSKQAIRDTSKCLDVDLKVVDYICKMIDSNKSLIENYNTNQNLKEYILSSNELKTMYKVSLLIENLKRHTSIHAAGVIISSKDIDEVIPLVKHDDFYTTGYSMEYLESLGLLKMDFLSLTTLTTIHDIIKDIKKIENIDIKLNEIKTDDIKTLKLFNTADTNCIFQFESIGMKKFLQKLKINNFEDIVSAVALYRPGPMQNIDLFIERKNDINKIDYLHEDLKEILSNTYGVIIYQEQVMQIAVKLASYTFAEADLLRKAMSKKKEDILLKEKDKFINRSINNGYDKDLSNKIFENILKFASYGFNRAHSVSYSMIAFQLAYLKAHYKIYFMKNILNNTINNESKTKDYIYECKKDSIKINNIDLYKSTNIYEIEDGLILPFSIIKGFGNISVNKIIEERKVPFKDIYNFINRVYPVINRKNLESLIYSSALDIFGYNKKTLINNLDVLINYSDIVKDLDEEFTLKPELILYEEFSNKELFSKELELYGHYISNHPITSYKESISNHVPLNNINLYFDKNINIIIYLDKVREVKTKNNEQMAFLTGSDEVTSIDLVMFPRIYKDIEIDIHNIYLVTGKVEKRFDKYQIIVNNIKKINES